METLTLNDGTVVNGHCILSSGKLFVYLDGMDIMDGFLMFSDPDKTAVITEMNHGHENIYEGYTQVDAVSREFGNCNLVMVKPEVN